MATVSVMTSDLLSTIPMRHTVESKGLVARAKDGDGAACHALFDAHARTVYSLCVRRTGETLDAERMTRDIFLAAFSNLNVISDEDAFRAEVYRQTVKSTQSNALCKGPARAASQPESASH